MADDASVIAAGWAAFAERDWGRARDCFSDALAGAAAEAFDGYGHALWFLGEAETGVEWRERACIAYAERGDWELAARVAGWIAHQHAMQGRESLARGWLTRAERGLEGRDDCAGAGWIAIERARLGGVEECIAGTRRALDIGRDAGDADLELFALSQLGRSEVAAGRYEEGMAHLEEAMTGAVAGRIASPQTLGETYCNMVTAAASAGDWERAMEWCAIVGGVARDSNLLPLHGACRALHADVLLASGRPDDAEQALADALAVTGYAPALTIGAVATLALLRIRQGRLPEAEMLLEGRIEASPILHALAHLRLAEGEPQIAIGLLRRALAAVEGDVLATARLVAALVGAALADGDLDDARAALGDLERLVAASDRPLLAASLDLATSEVAATAGETDRAHEHARRALERFGRLGMPHESAEARVALARSLADANPALAREEARAAHATFRDLGASRSADLAAALMRDLGAGSAPGPRGDGYGLTARERQVLELIARGLTNGEIGRRLFISEKTAGHHASRIFGKLGVRNRAEAATRARAWIE